MRQRSAFAIAAILIASACASPSAEQHGDYVLRGARRSFRSGDYDAALRYTELGMQREPFDQRAEEISLHLEILKAMHRDVEAAAFSEFVTRFSAGEDTDTVETVPTRNECYELALRNSHTTRLVREYAPLPIRRPFELGDMLATYEIDSEGRPINIRVVRAPHPASAWLIIDAIGEMKIWTSRPMATELQ